MKVGLDKVLGQVDIKATIADTIIEIDGEKLKAVGFAPENTPESIKVMAEKRVTMGDLFFLEPPRTFEAALKYREWYKVEISIVYEPIDIIKIRM